MSAPLRVLVAHNEYQQPGGEDSVVAAEVALLREYGHEVLEYRRSNHEIDTLGRARVALQTVWSPRTGRDIAELSKAFRPDVVHVHNTFPLISPSVYVAARRAGAPVVQTLHNFRLLCPQALLLRDGVVCEDCVGKLPWRGVVHRCYRGSATQTAVLATMIGVHRAKGTWQRDVTRYIALNSFCRDKFVEGGLPRERIDLKPNFVDLPPPGDAQRQGVLFVGRLSEEKGIAVLADAARRLPQVAFNVAGDGPSRPLLEGLPNVRLLGPQKPDAVYDAMRRAALLVIPSIWYENFPRTLVEAYACGVPVVASRIGALAELVDEGITGQLFEPRDPQSLASALSHALHDEPARARMGEMARAAYERELAPAANYRCLMGIYDRALAQRRAEAA